MDNRIETFKRWIAESKRIVAFTGAGASTESGIKDFRSADGLYSEKWSPNDSNSTESGIKDFRSVDGLYNQKFDYPPEEIISRTFFEKDPEYFYNFYRQKMLPLGHEPNITHKVLAKWEEEGRLSAVVTQNIDGLHQKAGAKKAFDEDFLMTVASVCAIFLGEFVEAAAVMLFFQVGELFESIAVERSRKSVAALMDLRPDVAYILVDGEWEESDPEDVQVGDLIRVNPGERIPVDGVIVEGSASVDTSKITGESVPADLQAGDKVLSGCIDLSALLRSRAGTPNRIFCFFYCLLDRGHFKSGRGFPLFLTSQLTPKYCFFVLFHAFWFFAHFNQ